MHFLMGSSTFSVIFKEMNESTNKEDPSAQTDKNTLEMYRQHGLCHEVVSFLKC